VVRSRDRDGVVLEQRIEAWRSKILPDAGSEADDTKLLEKMCQGVVFTVHLSPGGAVTRFEGYDQLLKKLGELNPAEARKFKAIAGEDVLRAPLRAVFDILPAAAVKKGDTWTRDVAVPMGPVGTFKVATTYTYQGLGDGGEQVVGTKGVFSFQPG